jgi:hypothetical protein
MISQFFTREEATITQNRQWIEANRLHAERYIRHVIAHGRETMDEARRILGKPIIVSSWVRCPGLNVAVGGSDTSDHVIGPLERDTGTERVGATDFICPSAGSAYDVAKTLARSDAFEFRQLIYEHTWVHLSSPRMVNGQRERPLRRILTLRPGGGYVEGIVLMSSLTP